MSPQGPNVLVLLYLWRHLVPIKQWISLHTHTHTSSANGVTVPLLNPFDTHIPMTTLDGPFIYTDRVTHIKTHDRTHTMTWSSFTICVPRLFCAINDSVCTESVVVTHTGLSLWIVGTFHRLILFYSVQAIFFIALNLPLSGNLVHCFTFSKNSFCMI